MFLSTSVVYFVGGILVIILGSSKLQSWASKQSNYEQIADD